MGGLSMNPENPGLETGPKLAHRIAEDEEWGGKPASRHEDQDDDVNFEKKEKTKMKVGSFEIDTTYPRTLLGFIRICQVLLMVVSFVCLVITSNWPDQGTYTFVCILMVFGALISSYLFFTVIAGLREDMICGISWIMVELVYFSVYGFLVFLGSCLGANNAQGNPALTASAVFGFFAVVTFGYYFWVTWQARKHHLSQLEEQKNEERDDDFQENEEMDTKPPLTPSFQERDEFAIEREGVSERTSRLPSVDFGRQNNSLPQNFKEQSYKNHSGFTEKNHRRRHSASDKDSAYSEGTITPTKGKVIPPKMRRTASANFDRDYDHVLHKQPLAHLSHRPYAEQPDLGPRRISGVNHHGGTGYGYPQELATNNFANMGYRSDGDRAIGDDLNDGSLRRQKSMPDWLRAALGEDVGCDDNFVDDQSEAGMFPVKKRSTLPKRCPREFPLLNTSDEESINYPSISQSGPGRQFNTLPPQSFHQRRGGGGENSLRHQRNRHSGHHHGRRRRGEHRHHHGRRNHHHLRPHHHRNHGRQHPGEVAGRRPINAAHDDFLRKMMENDELVMNDGSAEKQMRGFQPHYGKPIHTGKRRVIPEQPISIQFPEHSRWDDETGHLGNPVMEKYLADSQKMQQMRA